MRFRGKAPGTGMKAAAAALGLIAMSAVAAAQRPDNVATDAARFDVVSIKQNKARSGPASALELNVLRQLRPVTRNGRLRLEGVPLHSLIQLAYNLKEHQIIGAPSWAASDRFDVEAVAGDDATSERIRAMLKTLLADRFGLKLRREVRTLQVYELSPARGGVKVVPTKEGDCLVLRSDRPPPPPPTALIPCGGGFRRQIVSASPERLDRIEAAGESISTLVEFLSNELGRTVIDKTGLIGSFNLRLEFAPNLPGFDRGPSALAAPSPTVAPGLSIFTAVQEQLGLRLTSADGPVDVLVIEYVERAKEN
jgi:bla regulator protein blaR1